LRLYWRGFDHRENQIFKTKVNAVLVLDDDNEIAEIRVTPAIKLPPNDK
jgi:hypothetical protein